MKIITYNTMREGIMMLLYFIIAIFATMSAIVVLALCNAAGKADRLEEEIIRRSKK